MRIRSRLVLLSLGTLIPVLAFCVFMLVAFNRQTRAATEQGLVETARALSVAVDQNMSASILVLEALATSEHLRAGHLKEFHLTARTVLATQPGWQSIVVYSADGRELMNTSQPAGIPLPLSGNPGMIGQVARTRVPLVSDLFMGRTRHQPLVLAAVPVVRDGTAVYLLGASMDPETLTDLLSQQKVPPDTIGSLLDRNKVIIARTRAADRFVGQPGTSDLAAKMDETAEGSFRLFTEEGEPVYTAISRSPRTGWTIALGVPQSAADAPLRRSLWLLLLVGGSATLLGVGLAVLGARGIAKPIASLSTAAAALVRGGRIEAGSSALAEVNDVTRAMEQAGEERRRHEAAAAALAAVGRDLTGTLDLTQVTDRTVSAVLDLFRVRRALLYQVNDAADGLICVAAAGEPDPHKWLGRPLGKGEGVAGLAFAERRLVSSADITSDPTVTLPRWAHEQSRADGYEAVTGVPLMVRGRVLGVLALGDLAGRVFTDEELRLLTAFADQVAVALENSRLYEEVRRAFNELSETRDQLVQAQKMEAVGQLAGGIAHDFNNILTVIGGRSQLLLARTAADDPVRPHVELIAKASDRAAALTRQLLAFSRKQVLEPKVLDLNALVGGLATMLRRLIGEHIELLVVPGADLEQVLADPGQLEQVIMNLAVNARDAMPEGGMVKIETTALDLPDGARHAQGQIPPGHYATLIVQDTGCGIDSTTLTRVFEPFFTTKESGKGTGLGLSTVYGIVHQSGGFIGVDSTVGQGSTFTIYLPRTASPAEAVAASPLTGPTPRGRETILLVEDDDGIRGLISDVLKASGYTVLETGDPLEATVIGDRHPGPVHLLFTDIVMPAMQGPALAAELRAVRPEIGLLYMTGYTDDTIVTRDTIEPPGAFLQKPFLPNVLLRVVRDALDAGPKRSGRSTEPLHA